VRRFLRACALLLATTVAPLAFADDASVDAPVDAPIDAAPETGPKVVAIACPTPADHCEQASFLVTKSEKIKADFDFDTGWLPAGSPVQVRLVAFLHGRTRVDLGGTLDATWPDPIMLAPKGRPATGLLAIDDGFEVKAQGRFHVTVAGKDYDWTGDLPGIPGVDLSTKESVIFDPWAWKGGALVPTVTGKTGTVTLAKVPITSSIIPIPGISGGFDLDGAAEFSASYVTTRLSFDELLAKDSIRDVTSVFATTRVLLSDAPSFDTALTIHGELTHGMKLHFIPGFYFEILGKKFELPLADIPVSLPDATEDWTFDDVPIHVPLPRLEVKPMDVALGELPIGVDTPLLLTVFDTGEARVVLDAKDPKGVVDVTTTHLVIEPGFSDSLRAVVHPSTLGPIDTTIEVRSNDPLAPLKVVHVRGVAVQSVGDAGPSADDATSATGGCSCRTASPDANASWALAPFGALLLLGLRARGRSAARGARSTSSRPRG
jgi:MYXO-CTERM domain-containing protein